MHVVVNTSHSTDVMLYNYVLLQLPTCIIIILYSGYIKSRHLNIIKWEDESGKLQPFYLTEKIACKWRTIGELIGLTYSKLQSLDNKYRRQHRKQEKCCQAVLELWLDNPPPGYPSTWQGLIKVLEDSELGDSEVATELRTVLSRAVDL
jgi:hypothetical protein